MSVLLCGHPIGRITHPSVCPSYWLLPCCSIFVLFRANKMIMTMMMVVIILNLFWLPTFHQSNDASHFRIRPVYHGVPQRQAQNRNHMGAIVGRSNWRWRQRNTMTRCCDVRMSCVWRQHWRHWLSNMIRYNVQSLNACPENWRITNTRLERQFFVRECETVNNTYRT